MKRKLIIEDKSASTKQNIIADISNLINRLLLLFPTYSSCYMYMHLQDHSINHKLFQINLSRN